MSDQFYQEDNHLLLCCGRLVGGVLPLLRLHSDPRLIMIMITVMIVVMIMVMIMQMIMLMIMMVMVMIVIMMMWRPCAQTSCVVMRRAGVAGGTSKPENKYKVSF